MRGYSVAGRWGYRRDDEVAIPIWDRVISGGTARNRKADFANFGSERGEEACQIRSHERKLETLPVSK